VEIDMAISLLAIFLLVILLVCVAVVPLLFSDRKERDSEESGSHALMALSIVLGVLAVIGILGALFLGFFQFGRSRGVSVLPEQPAISTSTLEVEILETPTTVVSPQPAKVSEGIQDIPDLDLPEKEKGK
jgi:heme/copper-type cytochrome/quinol oxidase subunit 2